MPLVSEAARSRGSRHGRLTPDTTNRFDLVVLRREYFADSVDIHPLLKPISSSPVNICILSVTGERVC